MLLLACCYCFILVQILKTHHLDAKINKIWLFMMLGIDPTIHRLKKKKKAKLVKLEKVAHSVRRMIC